jgi:uncharacterized protein (UPF0548 family)
MFLARRPDQAFIDRQLAAARTLRSPSYPCVGATRHAPKEPPLRGFVVDHNRFLLGQGEAAFTAARRALDSWAMFATGWTRIHHGGAPALVGDTVAIEVNLPMIQSLNFARIVYRIDQEREGDVRRYGFAYGTLETHVECGEERFSVELNERSGEVYYDLYAFSRPQHVLVKMASFYGRKMQRRFARDSLVAMAAAVR